MNAKTLKAHKGSIKKWVGVCDGTNGDMGADNCDLCQLFLGGILSGKSGECGQCPVGIAGQPHCEGGQWERWYDYHAENGEYNYGMRKVFDDKSLRLAQDQLMFLVSLLPPKASMNFVLTHHWYDQMILGLKDHEYRNLNTFWITRLGNCGGGETMATFRRGYTSTRIQRRIKGLVVGACPYDGWDGDFIDLDLGPIEVQQ